MKKITSLRSDGIILYPVSCEKTIAPTICVETAQGVLEFSVPQEIQNRECNCPAGMLQYIWCAVEDTASCPLCWFYFNKFSAEKRDVQLDIVLAKESEFGPAFTAALQRIRYEALTLRELQYITVETSSFDMVTALESCRFELMRVVGERYYMEFQRHYSRRFPLYLGISVLLGLLLYLVFQNILTALAVAFSLGIGGGFVYDMISQQRFQSKRARIRCQEIGLAEENA